LLSPLLIISWLFSLKKERIPPEETFIPCPNNFPPPSPSSFPRSTNPASSPSELIV